MVLLSGLWVAPLGVVVVWLRPGGTALVFSGLLLLALAPVPTLLVARRRGAQVAAERDEAVERAEQAALLCETTRFRAQRLADELTDADRQAREAHHLALLGQFVAGFLHEVNNPLAILTGRVEVLINERGGDEGLCRDLGEILKEARYIEKIAGALLPALRQSRAEGAFEPALPDEAIGSAVSALGPLATAQGVALLFEPSGAPRVNLPAHAVEEVARALISNALQAMEGLEGGRVWLRVRPTGQTLATVVVEVEDNGPGVPDDLRAHLFEPFVTRSRRSQRTGLGLFIAASLLRVYEGSLRYERGESGGARFVVEAPRARFTKEQPYHWFVSAYHEEEKGL